MKFNLFSLVNDKRQKKKGPNRVLSDWIMRCFCRRFPRSSASCITGCGMKR